MKKIFGIAAIATLALAGCSKNEVVEMNDNAPGYINLGATTTRAAINRVDSMRNDHVGFKVYATTANAATVWYNGGSGQVIDGTNNHVYADNKWNFVNKVKWPTATAAYPMTFYAYYPSAPAGQTMTSQTASALKGTYKVQTTSATQVDYLAAKAATGGNKPSNDVLNITFNHILSKINYGFNVEFGFNAYVQALAVKNVEDERSYDFLACNWEGTVSAANCDNSYLYSGMLGDGSSPNTALKAATKTYIGNSNNTPIYQSKDNANLMLMTQNVPEQLWTPVSGEKPGSKTYVYMIYRVQKTSPPTEPNYIGYANATDHPGYEDSDVKTRGYTGALYVVVGYPFTLNWEKGKGYTYNIALPGTSGGILIEENYYDEDGNETDLPVENIDPGDPILGDGYIHLVPIVEDWGANSNTNLQ